MSGQDTAQQDAIRANVSVQADQIADGLAELAQKLISPVYELFDFFVLPAQLVVEEPSRMRSHTF